MPDAKVERLLESIDYKDAEPDMPPAPRRYIMLATSIAAACIAIAIVLVYQNQTQQAPTQFQTATSTDQVAAMNYVLNIRFTSGSRAVVRERILSDINAENIVVGVDDEVYRVTVNLQVGTLDDLERFTQDVASLQQVQSVEVIALQLPLRSP